MQIDEPTRERFRQHYEGLFDHELLAITANPDRNGPEACAAAADVLRRRTAEIVARESDVPDDRALEAESTAPVCDRCGGDEELERVPFVVARRGGWDWDYFLGRIARP